MNSHLSPNRPSRAAAPPRHKPAVLLALALLPWPAMATADTYTAPAPYDNTIRLDSSAEAPARMALPTPRRPCVNDSAIAANHRNRPGRINTIGLCDPDAEPPTSAMGTEVPVQEQVTESFSEEVQVQSVH